MTWGAGDEHNDSAWSGKGSDKAESVNNFGGSDGGAANNGACFNCGEPGHMKSECPNPRVNTGNCYNCGEPGHNKADCPNPTVAREFTGTCRLCEQEGHRAADCPTAGPKLCKNCGEEGHTISVCKNPRKVNRGDVDDVLPEVAWDELVTASREKDLDDVKTAVDKYIKAIPATTFVDLERAFRSQEINVYLIAFEREIAATYTNMDLQGNLDRKYTVSYRLSEKPKRPKEAVGWPSTPEENMERLKDAGFPVDRGIPKCSNCDQLGHISRSCPQEKQEVLDRASVKCFNCDQPGHRVRDCPEPRADKFACRNCNQSGHSAKDCPEPRNADNVECKKCGETGHFARDCPTGGDGGMECRNCGEDGHRAKDCPNPKNPATMVCRNCDETGHMSKECPKPRDYSRVKCSNCQGMGHTKVRCKKPPVDEDLPNVSDTGAEPTRGGDANGAHRDDDPSGWEANNNDSGGW